MKRGVTVECTRCGNEQEEPRAGRYDDRDYLENWHDLMQAQAEIKRLRAELDRTQHKLLWWMEHAAWLSERWVAMVRQDAAPQVEEPAVAALSEDYNPFP